MKHRKSFCFSQFYSKELRKRETPTTPFLLPYPSSTHNSPTKFHKTTNVPSKNTMKPFKKNIKTKLKKKNYIQGSTGWVVQKRNVTILVNVSLAGWRGLRWRRRRLVISTDGRDGLTRRRSGRGRAAGGRGNAIARIFVASALFVRVAVVVGQAGTRLVPRSAHWKFSKQSGVILGRGEDDGRGVGDDFDWSYSDRWYDFGSVVYLYLSGTIVTSNELTNTVWYLYLLKFLPFAYKEYIFQDLQNIYKISNLNAIH